MNTQTSTSTIASNAVRAARDIGFAFASHSAKRSAASFTRSAFKVLALATLPPVLLGLHRRKKEDATSQSKTTKHHIRRRALHALVAAILLIVVGTAIVAPKALPGLLLMAVIIL